VYEVFYDVWGDGGGAEIDLTTKLTQSVIKLVDDIE